MDIKEKVIIKISYNCNLTEYYLNGKLHREDGPAAEWEDGFKLYALHGNFLNCTTQEEFVQLMRLKAFL